MKNQRRTAWALLVTSISIVCLAIGTTEVVAEPGQKLQGFVQTAPTGNLIMLEAIADNSSKGITPVQLRTEVPKYLGMQTINDEVVAKQGLNSAIKEYQQVQRGVDLATEGFKDLDGVLKVVLFGGLSSENPTTLGTLTSAVGEVVEERIMDRILKDTEKVGNLLTQKAVNRAMAEYDKTHDLKDLKGKTAAQVYQELQAGKYLPQYADTEALVNAGSGAQQAFQGRFIRQLADLQQKGFEVAADQGRKLEQQGYTIKDVQLTAKKLRSEYDGLTSYVQEVSTRVTRVEQNLKAVQENVGKLTAQVNEQGKDILQNKKDIRQLQSMMFEKMSPKEQLALLNNGFNPGMSAEERAKLIKQTEVAQSRVELIEDSQKFITKSSQVLEIARNIGLDGKLLDTLSKGVEVGQAIAGGIAAFAAQDYLGGVASVSRLMGIGGRGGDPGAARHEQVMNALNKISGQISEVKASVQRVQESVNRVILLQTQALQDIQK